MANEISIQASLTVRKGYINKQHADSFTATLNGNKGPSIGVIEVPLTGVQLSFTQLTTPGVAFLKNIGRVTGTTLSSDYIEIGIRDPTTNKFYPLLSYKPGEAYPLRFSPNLLEEYAGTGTNSTGDENYLWCKAHGAAQNLQVDAYEN